MTIFRDTVFLDIIGWTSGDGLIATDGNVQITGSLDMTGTITAREFHTELVSSSIIYLSGSTLFGDTLDDVHENTGSLLVTGSLNVNNGGLYISGALVGIGTEDPKEQLHVFGIISASNILTDQGGSFWTASGANITRESDVKITGSLIISASGDDDTFQVIGHADIIHQVESDGEHGLEIDVLASGFADVKALDIAYAVGPITGGQDEEIILTNIDISGTLGGTVVALEVLSTEGSASVYGLESSVGVNPVISLVGSFGNATTGLVNAVDQTDAFTGSENVSLFVANGDTVTLGLASKFEEIEFIFETFAANPGVKPTFEYSTGDGTWASFTPSDGTNGMRNNGIVLWLNSDIPGWVVGAGSEFLIRITRTQGGLSVVPVEQKIQLASGITEYKWDKDGGLFVSDVTASNIDIGGVSGSTGDGVIYAVTGSFQLLEKAAGTFKILHPDPSKSDKNLYHSFVESPTAGDNIYRFEIQAFSDNEQVTTDLPEYFRFLNEKPQIFVQALGQFAQSYASVDQHLKKLRVVCEKKGFYDVLLIATRKDKDAVQAWTGGVERDK